ncbi:MAG: PAS domain-containing protein [Deltaproteobacteria bacterium]|nr:PAS domain-containing protein [Deltaproteobacteria bacterium]
MADPHHILRIGVIGGNNFCREVLTKTDRHYHVKYVPGQIVAVADPDPESPGMVLARELGIYTTSDYHDFYKPETGIDQIFIFTSDEAVLQDVLKTRPLHIRFMAYHTIRLFWEMIQFEERRLMTQRDELETIINGIEDDIVVIGLDYKIIQVNRPLLERMSCTEAELIGQSCHKIFHHSDEPCQPPEHPCPLEAALQEKRSIQAIHTHSTMNGEDRIIDLTIHPLRDLDGEIYRFVEITRDITERYRAQEEMTRRLEKAVEERTHQLEETYEKLIQQDKMTSLGKLSASVVHELNNPLTGILTFTRLIQRMIAEKEMNQELLDYIVHHLRLMETETARCSKIVSNLLAFARQSKIEPEVGDINSIIEQVLTLNSHYLSLNRIEVKENFESGLPKLFCDVDQVQQVLMNLIFNATESIPEDQAGHLSLSTHYDEKEDMVLIRVADTGPGIPEANLPHIFEPFFTTKPETKGVGLGLSVIYGIIKEHAGQIEVEKTGPKGTTFLVKFPAYHPESEFPSRSEVRRTG